ncbi:hypothetical protein EYR36_003380 [Pleurotus pulmonarius]|nr:hypothetical protein EYR36_003380 [Pleurotus pulmonarius]
MVDGELFPNDLHHLQAVSLRLKPGTTRLQETWLGSRPTLILQLRKVVPGFLKVLDANGPFPQHFEDDDDLPSEIHPRKRALSTSATSQVAKKRITKENHPPSSPRRASQPLSNPKGTSRSKGKSAAIKKTSKIPENGEGDTIIASIRWTSEERSILFAFILGPESDRMFEMLGVNPGRVFAKAEGLFKDRFTAKAIRSHWTRSLKTYNGIAAFEAFTGNGGGDGDLSDDSLDSRIMAARKKSLPVGNLTAAIYKEWSDQGWLELFHSRYSHNPNITRDVEFHSGLPVSDDEVLAKGTPNKLRHEAASSLQRLTGFLEVRAKQDDQRFRLLNDRFELEKAKEDRAERLDQQRLRMEMAKQGLASEDPEIQEASKAFILKLLSN